MSYKNYKSVFADKTIMLNLIKKIKKKYHTLLYYVFIIIRLYLYRN